MSRVFHLKTPITDENLREISVRDVVYLSGIIVTGRGAVHERVVRGNQILPIDLRGLALYHAGPVVRKKENKKWWVVSAGPTTSMRMEPLEAEFI